jgi:glycosyltransferase involved in cell wall biosynthesis
MRILHTEWSDGWGGQERRIIAEMAGMARRGHHIVLATRPHAKIAAKAREANIGVIELPFSRRTDLGSILRLARYLKRERIDVANTHSGVDSWIGGLAAKLAGTPVLVRTRHLNLPLKRNLLNFVHYLPDRIITCGEGMRRHLAEGCGFPPGQLVSIPTGIDFAAFSPRKSRDAVREELRLREGDFVVLMVGIIRGVKRHEIALKATKQLLAAVPRAQLVLAGEGPMQPDMERLARELGIADRVHFLGHRDDVPDLMAAADVLLLTSRSEGVPQAVTQALGLGLPVVATKVGGVPELIEHERTGLLIPPENPEAAAEALTRIAQDRDWAAKLGTAGREHVLAHFSLEAMLDHTEQLFVELLEQGNGEYS